MTRIVLVLLSAAFFGGCASDTSTADGTAGAFVDAPFDDPTGDFKGVTALSWRVGQASPIETLETDITEGDLLLITYERARVVEQYEIASCPNPPSGPAAVAYMLYGEGESQQITSTTLFSREGAGGFLEGRFEAPEGVDEVQFFFSFTAPSIVGERCFQLWDSQGYNVNYPFPILPAMP